MLVLLILPFGADAFLEEMVVGLDSKIGARRDVVLPIVSDLKGKAEINQRHT